VPAAATPSIYSYVSDACAVVLYFPVYIFSPYFSQFFFSSTSDLSSAAAAFSTRAPDNGKKHTLYPHTAAAGFTYVMTAQYDVGRGQSRVLARGSYLGIATIILSSESFWIFPRHHCCRPSCTVYFLIKFSSVCRQIGKSESSKIRRGRDWDTVRARVCRILSYYMRHRFLINPSPP